MKISLRSALNLIPSASPLRRLITFPRCAHQIPVWFWLLNHQSRTGARSAGSSAIFQEQNTLFYLGIQRCSILYVSGLITRISPPPLAAKGGLSAAINNPRHPFPGIFRFGLLASWCWHQPTEINPGSGNAADKQLSTSAEEDFTRTNRVAHPCLCLPNI